MRRIFGFVLALALAAPSALPAQDADAAAPQRRGPGVGPGAWSSPAALALRHRSELGLTQQQVEKLEALDARLKETRAKHLEALREARGEVRRGEGVRPRDMTPEQREAMRKRMEEARPAMEAMREANRQAREELHGILTQEQQTRLHEIRREQMDELRARRGERRGTMQRRGEGRPPRG